VNVTAEELRQFVERQDAELKAVNKRAQDELAGRLTALEQLATSHSFGGGGGFSGSTGSFGEIVTASEGFKAVTKGANRSGQISIGSFHKATPIINAPGPLQPLVPDIRVPGIIPPGMPALTVRDVLAQFRTQSNLIQYTRELSFDNQAAPQAGENVSKAQSSMTFELKNAPVQTLAHWIACSRQVLDDSVALMDYLNTRLLYGLKLAEEKQLLGGDGTGQNLSGLILNSTPYSGYVAGDTVLDTLGRAINQVENVGFKVDAVLLNPGDKWRAYLQKTTYGEYVFADPYTVMRAQLWSVPVVTTVNLMPGQFLVGAFKQACAVWDKWDATIEVSREHQDFFIKNMVAILCEERLALTVFRSDGIVHGSFGSGS
jgi:HK97 family phage major capsid protein